MLFLPPKIVAGVCAWKNAFLRLLLFFFSLGKSYKDNLFPFECPGKKARDKQERNFRLLKVFKRDLKQLKLLPSRPGRRERQFTGGYSQEIARIFGASESS